MRTRKLAAVALALGVAGWLAPGAAGDGLPVLGLDAGPEGVTTPEDDDRFTTLAAGPRTVVARIAKDGGRVVASRALTGRFVVPVVAYDGSAAGLSSDGNLLVLIRPRARFPRATTPLVVLDASSLRLRQRLVLEGDFSFDAISPNGRWAYFVEYVDPADPNRYLVRALDTRSGRLLAKPIVDPAEEELVMRGAPITRAASPDGRWAYTLYDGAGGEPFVHALDTERRRAVCVDLPQLEGRADLWDLRLAIVPGGAWFAVERQGEALATIDARTFAVRAPATSELPPARPRLAPPR